MIYTPVSIGGGTCCKCNWFKPTNLQSGGKTYAIVKPGVIYRSFNLKDMMVYSGYIDQQTAAKIKDKEGDISGHVINGLMDMIEIKEYDALILKIHVGPNLYPTGAEIITAPLNSGNLYGWSGYPEPFIFDPPFKFDQDGMPENDVLYRSQKAAMIPIAYCTNDDNQEGPTITFGSGKDAKTQKFIRVLCDNIMMTTFNYDGTPVSYPTQALLQPFFWYKTGS